MTIIIKRVTMSHAIQSNLKTTLLELELEYLSEVNMSTAPKT